MRYASQMILRVFEVAGSSSFAMKVLCASGDLSVKMMMIVNRMLICGSLGWLDGVGLRGECVIRYSRHPVSITVIRGLMFAV